MAEAGRKVLRFHFERMLEHEPGTLAGEDPEALHDMRVATRRQRAALRLFAPYFKRKAIRPFRRELRTLGSHLGAVRDLDVLLEAAKAYQAALDPGEAEALSPVLESWRDQREQARADLLAYLESDKCVAFKETYGAFLEEEGAGAQNPASGSGAAAQPTWVQHTLPGRVWDHYGVVRAYEPVLAWASLETLHALRIEAKRLRYALEFFREVLDPGVEEAITAVVGLQDHLGELHDADVLAGLLQDLLRRGTSSPGTRQAVEHYLIFEQARLRTLQRLVKRPWRQVTRPRFRRLLARALAGL
jgi:CHAD domain-containing protein